MRRGQRGFVGGNDPSVVLVGHSRGIVADHFWKALVDDDGEGSGVVRLVDLNDVVEGVDGNFDGVFAGFDAGDVDPLVFEKRVVVIAKACVDDLLLPFAIAVIELRLEPLAFGDDEYRVTQAERHLLGRGDDRAFGIEQSISLESVEVDVVVIVVEDELA